MAKRKWFGFGAIVFLIISVYSMYSAFQMLDPVIPDYEFERYLEGVRLGVLVAIVGCLAAGVLIWFVTFYKDSDRQLRAERARLEDMAKIKALREELGLPDESDKGRAQEQQGAPDGQW